MWGGALAWPLPSWAQARARCGGGGGGGGGGAAAGGGGGGAARRGRRLSLPLPSLARWRPRRVFFNLGAAAICRHLHPKRRTPSSISRSSSPDHIVLPCAEPVLRSSFFSSAASAAPSSGPSTPLTTSSASSAASCSSAPEARLLQP